MEELSGLAEEELDELVPAAGEDELLEVVGDAVRALLVELLQRVYPHLRGELVLEELGIHEFGTGVSFDQQHGLNHILMGEEPQGRSLLVDIPNNDALIVRPAHKRLPVFRDA